MTRYGVGMAANSAAWSTAPPAVRPAEPASATIVRLGRADARHGPDERRPSARQTTVRSPSTRQSFSRGTTGSSPSPLSSTGAPT
jgi:hypothetical protein